MLERCRMICGDNLQQCFADNQKQIDCLGDMIVNKAFSIALLLEQTKEKGLPVPIAENLDLALQKVKELTDWVKYLQVVRDVKKCSLLLENYTPGNRKELRFPLSQDYIKIMLHVGDDVLEGELLDFSERGIGFTCPRPLALGDTYHCTIYTVRPVKQSMSFEVAIRHCSKKGGIFIAGASVLHVHDEEPLDFFNSTLDFIRGDER